MARARRQFSPEYKQEAVRLVEDGRSILDVARSLGIRADLLRKWRQQIATAAQPQDVFPGHGKLTSQDEEIRRLRRENEVLRQERDFAKKAAVFFAKESR
jgi:transposase